MPRVDVREKVLGYGQYPDDTYEDGMIYGSALRSAYPRALVKFIDTEKAKALPGVIGIFTAEDIPGSVKVGHLKQDWDGLIPVGKSLIIWEMRSLLLRQRHRSLWKRPKS